MKKLSTIAVALFLMAVLLSPLGCETGPQGGPPPGKAMMDAPAPGGPGGPAPAGPGGPDAKAKAPEGKGKAPQLTHEEFVELHDKNGDGEVTLEEFLAE